MQSMFDIYTVQNDGTMLLVESVECQAIARETAYHLSKLFPDESFVYLDRAEDGLDLSALWEVANRLESVPHAQVPLPN
jgi:hypothetical protein